MSLLLVEDVHISYGNVEAVFGVSLQAKEGRITTIIGPNGAGKTTLLSALAGLLPISQGRVLFDGVDISAMATEARVERGLVLVPEKRELFPDMAVHENLQLGAYHRRFESGRVVRDSMEEVFVLFPRLKERWKQSAETLSGGERQMLALGRALMSKPRLLLLDEPSLGLAPLITRKIFEIISNLVTNDVSVMLVEQNARAALAVAEYGYVVEQGRIVMDGMACALASDPKVAKTYLGHNK